MQFDRERNTSKGEDADKSKFTGLILLAKMQNYVVLFCIRGCTYISHYSGTNSFVTIHVEALHPKTNSVRRNTNVKQSF
jgi:hypothetical protein